MFRPLRKGMIYTGFACFALAFLNLSIISPAPSSLSSGVKGVILSGPSCPVQRIDNPCPDRPIKGARIEIAGRSTTSGSDGRFKIGLIPGSWVMKVSVSDIGFSKTQAKTTRVQITSNHWTSEKIIFDSGIR
jgi:hypothetical protein